MKYILKRLGVLIAMLFLVSFITFIAFLVIPGDSAVMQLGTEATKEAVEALRESKGLNDPLPIRYGRWLGDVLHGDFGESTTYHMSVQELLHGKFQVTICLAILAILLIGVIGILLGLAIAKAKNETWQQILAFFTQAFMSIPPFFLGMLLTLLFGLILKWFVPGKFVPFAKDPVGFFGYLIFPALAIAIPKISMVAQFTSSSIRRETGLDYVRTAFGKGTTRNYVFHKHILKNAMMPVVTFMGMIIADVLAGSIIVEQVFNLPGIGRLLVTSIGNRDLYVVQAIILYIVSVVVLVNFVVDLLYQLIDPRVRL